MQFIGTAKSTLRVKSALDVNSSPRSRKDLTLHRNTICKQQTNPTWITMVLACHCSNTNILCMLLTHELHTFTVCHNELLIFIVIFQLQSNALRGFILSACLCCFHSMLHFAWCTTGCVFLALVLYLAFAMPRRSNRRNI